MCDPVSALLVTGGLMTAKGQMDQGDYARQVGENNARYQEASAKDALVRGTVAENAQRRQLRALQGKQVAALAANGIDSSTGTGLNLLTDTAGEGEFDAQTIRSNAYKQAYGLETQASNSRSEGLMAQHAGNMNAMGTLLTTGSRAYAANKGVKLKKD